MSAARATLRTVLWSTVGLLTLLRDPRERNERGLSQSAENAILLLGAVTVAGIVISAITIYVKNHMPR